MSPETVDTNRQELERQLRAGTILRAAVDGLGLSHKAFAAAADVESGTLRRLWNETTAGPVLDVTKAQLIAALGAQREALEAVPDIEELIEGTRRRVTDALIHGKHGIADWLISKWWFQTGKQPMDDRRRSQLRNARTNVPEFSELLGIAREIGLLTDEDAQRPWENPAVQDAIRAWLYEAVERTGRPAGLAHFVVSLQLAGLRTTGEGLQCLTTQCMERGIRLKEGTSVDVSAADASLIVNHKVPPFPVVQPILLAVEAHTQRPGLTADVEALWDRVERKEEAAFGRVEQMFNESGFAFRELAYVTGVPYASGTQENNVIYSMVRGKHERAPFRALAVALAPDPEALQSLDACRTQEIVEWHRLRGRRRDLPQAAVLRELWAFTAEDLDVDAAGFEALMYDRSGALEDDLVVERIESVGAERARELLVRWLERRGMYSGRQVMLALCERHKAGEHGTGVAKLEKDLGSKDFRDLYEHADHVMSPQLLREMLEKVAGVPVMPPGLEARHRLDYAGFLASEAGGGLNARQRFFELVITDRHRSQFHYHQSLSHDENIRQSFKRMFRKLGEGGGGGEVAGKHLQTLVQTTGDLEPRLHRLFVALTAQGTYPEAVAVICREWMNGDDVDQRAAHDLLAVLRMPEARDLVPHPLGETAGTVSLSRLFDARWKTRSERDGTAWNDDCDDCADDRRAARTLRLLPGITQEEFVQTAELLRFEVAAHGIDSLMETALRPHTDETMARLAGFVAPLVNDEWPETRVLHAVQVSPVLYGQWKEAAARVVSAPSFRRPQDELHDVLPRTVDAELLRIRHEAGASRQPDEADLETIQREDAELIARWGTPELRLAILVRRLALAAAVAAPAPQEAQPEAAGEQATVVTAPVITVQQRELMCQIIELIFARHGDTDELDRQCRKSSVDAGVLAAWRASRKREETKRRVREQGTELEQLRTRVAELERLQDGAIPPEERAELEDLRTRARALQRQMDDMVDFIPPSVHTKALERIDELMGQIGSRQPAGTEPTAYDQGLATELQAEVERLREELRTRPVQATVERVEVRNVLPRELHGSFITGNEMSLSGDPVIQLLNILSAPVINARAFLQVYRRAIEVMGATADIGGPLHDDMIYVQQYAAGVVGGRRDPIAGVVQRLMQKLRGFRTSWQPPEQHAAETSIDSQTAFTSVPVVRTGGDSAIQQRANDAERLRTAAEEALERLRGRYQDLHEQHESLQRDTEMRIREALAARDEAQAAQRRLEKAGQRQVRELEAAAEREQSLSRELDRVRMLLQGASVDTVEDDASETADLPDEAVVAEAGPVDASLLPQYRPHPEDDSGVDFARLARVGMIGEYLEHYLGPDSAGFTLQEPASESAARRIASLEVLDTTDITAALHVVACCYSPQPLHPGNALIIGRLRRYLTSDEPTEDEMTNTQRFADAVEEMLADEDAQAAVERLRTAAPDHPLLALIDDPLPEPVVVQREQETDEDDDLLSEKDGEQDRPRKKKKKKKTRVRRKDEDDDFDSVPGLRELIGGDVSDEGGSYQPSPEELAEAERWASEEAE